MGGSAGHDVLRRAGSTRLLGVGFRKWHSAFQQGRRRDRDPQSVREMLGPVEFNAQVVELFERVSPGVSTSADTELPSKARKIASARTRYFSFGLASASADNSSCATCSEKRATTLGSSGSTARYRRPDPLRGHDSFRPRALAERLASVSGSPRPTEPKTSSRDATPPRYATRFQAQTSGAHSPASAGRRPITDTRM